MIRSNQTRHTRDHTSMTVMSQVRIIHKDPYTEVAVLEITVAAIEPLQFALIVTMGDILITLHISPLPTASRK